MAEFFKVLYKMNISSSHGGIPTFLSTHPDPGDRYNSVNENAKRWQDSLKLSEYRVGRDNYLKLVDGVIYGDDPRQGYSEGNKFYHPEMKFQFTFPAGWQLQNSPMQITIAPSDGSALILFTVSAEKSLKAAADSSNSRMKLIPFESKSITVNGMPTLWSSAKQVSTDQSTGSESVNRILSYYINYGNVIYAFHGVSSEGKFSSFSGAFESAMGSFAKLTDQSKINVTPSRIRVKQVAKAGTLSEAFTVLGVKQPQMAELALLNNMELTDKVEAGKLIKIVGK
jgi:predicted Zn-dependent protease